MNVEYRIKFAVINLILYSLLHLKKEEPLIAQVFYELKIRLSDKLDRVIVVSVCNY